MSGWEKVGEIGVDAGCVMVGDPCYTQGRDASHAAESWKDFLTQTWPEVFGPNAKPDAQMGSVSPALGDEILGIVVESGWGDGVYPVYVRHDPRSGRVSAVKVEFMEDDDDDDEEDWS
jgi:hypothetical protein